MRVTFRVDARLANRAVAFDLVGTLVGHVKAGGEDFRHAVTTAFGEAYNNVVIHAYRGRTDGVLEVEAEVSPEHITLHLKDTGKSADFEEVALPDLDGLPEGGLGVYMMRALLDEVVYKAGTPNVLTLTKRTGGACPPPTGSPR